MTQDSAALKELRRIRAALERPNVEPVYVDYATAAKMLCTSKRSIERLISEKRLKPVDIAGPKLRVSDLRALGEQRGRASTARAPRAASEARRARELVAAAAQGEGLDE
jgi:hypothetical protein